MGESIGDWVDERTGYRSLVERVLREPLPRRVNWWFTLGSLLLVLLILQLATGAALVMYYVPAPPYAWESVRFITERLRFGRVLRGLHVFGASFIVIAAVAHLVRVVVLGAYKRPREVTWWSGMTLLLLILAFALTGYLLPWDQRAYWATVVTINIARSAPGIGPWLADVLRGGPHLGALTLSRWFAVHVILLPIAAATLTTAHLFLMRRHGIAGVPGPPPRRRELLYPDHLFRDAVVAGVAFALLLMLAIFVGPSLAPVADPSDASYVPRPEWYFLSLFQLLKYFPGRLEPIAAHGIPAALLFVLAALPFIDRGDSREPRRRRGILFGTTVVLATLAALTVLALRDRPASAGSTTWGARALAGGVLVGDRRCVRCHAAGSAAPDLARGRFTRDLGWIDAHVADPETIAPGTRPTTAEGLRPLEARAVLAYVTGIRSGQPPPRLADATRSAMAVFGTRCIACHKLDGDGSTFGPDLSHVGARRDVEWLARWITNPGSIDAKADMPAFGSQLTADDIRAVARFLASRK